MMNDPADKKQNAGQVRYPLAKPSLVHERAVRNRVHCVIFFQCVLDSGGLPFDFGRDLATHHQLAMIPEIREQVETLLIITHA